MSPVNPKPDAALKPLPDGTRRLTVREKIAYGIGSANDAWGNWLLPGIVWPVFNMYLGMSPTMVSLALLWNRLIDAFADPFFGWASDNTRSRYGRRRPYILVGSILSGLGMIAFFWFIQKGWSPGAYYWYLMIGSSILLILVSCFNMPYQSLGAEMTPDYEERTSVFAFRGGLQKIAEIGNFAAAAFITLHFFQGDILYGAKIYSIIIGVLMIVVGITTFAGVKERYYGKVANQERVGLIETFVGALKCPPFRAQLAMALSYGIGTSMVGALGYYTTVYYVCRGDIALGSKWNLAMGAATVVVGFLGVPFFARLAHRYSKRKAMIVVILSSIVVFASSWFLYTPAVQWLQLVAAGFIAFTQAAFWMLYGAIGADVIDYDEWETGKRREGAFSACGSYLMKVGLAIGLGSSGYVLEYTGFDAKLGAAQLPEALDRIRLFLVIIPIIGLILALVFLLRCGLTRERSEQIRRELEARRGAVV